MEIDAVSEGMTPRRTVSCSAPITRESHLQGDGAVELLAENLPYVISPWTCGPVVRRQG